MFEYIESRKIFGTLKAKQNKTKQQQQQQQLLMPIQMLFAAVFRELCYQLYVCCACVNGGQNRRHSRTVKSGIISLVMIGYDSRSRDRGVQPLFSVITLHVS